MLLEEIRKIVTEPSVKKFRVTEKDGRAYYVRLWQTDKGIGIMNKGAKRWGKILEWYHCANWKSLTPINKREIDIYKRMVKRASDALEMLNRSGFWPEIKKEIEYFLTHEEEAKRVVEDLENSTLHRNYYDAQYSWMHSPQIFETFACTKCWKSIAWHKWYKHNDKHRLHNAVENKCNFSVRWKNGYDCSVEVCFDNGMARGWYSEEFVNCANGWYYLLFDEKHAIFYERD